jgi:hypothetical protein
MGHWIPVTWLTFSVDHALWGMNAFGYHLTNILLHVVTPRCSICWRFAAAAPCTASAGAIRLGAIVTALFFALHPPGGIGGVVPAARRAVGAVLPAHGAGLSGRRPRSGCAPTYAFVAAIGVVLGIMVMRVVLLVRAVSPLRRARGSWRRVLLEKLPYLCLAIVAAVISVLVVIAKVGLTSSSAYPLTARVAMALYSLAFYVWKTLVPLLRSPMYDLPERVELTSPRFLVPALFAAGLTIGLVLARRSWPARWPRGSSTGLTSRPSAASSRGAQLVPIATAISPASACLFSWALPSPLRSRRGNRRPVRGVVLAGFAWIAGLTA